MPRKIINNYVYDTKEAKLVMAWRQSRLTWLSGYMSTEPATPELQNGSEDIELFLTSKKKWFFCVVNRGFFGTKRKYSSFHPVGGNEVYSLLHSKNEIELLETYFKERIKKP